MERIIGGRPMSKPIPWQVSIGYKIEYNKFIHFCGGVILNMKTIISAAHCFPNWSIPIYVKAGIKDTTLKTPTIKIVKTIFYSLSRYNSTTKAQDIVLLKLEKSLQSINMEDSIQPICLPDSKKQIETGQSCYVSGWGALKSSGIIKTC